MSNSFSSLCDDFYLDMCINTELDLPTDRDTILAFFERIQKQYPSIGNFYRRGQFEYCMEEPRETGQYKWVSLESNNIVSGSVNPSDIEEVYKLDNLVLQLVPYMLGVNHLDIDSLDVTFGMDFDYKGNHNEVIAEAFCGATGLNCFSDLANTTPVDFSPAIMVGLTEDCRTQARIAIESKTGVYEIRKQSYKSDEAISLSFTIRQYPQPEGKFDAIASFKRQCQLAEELMTEKIIPNFVQPLTNVISQKRLI